MVYFCQAQGIFCFNGALADLLLLYDATHMLIQYVQETLLFLELNMDAVESCSLLKISRIGGAVAGWMGVSLKWTGFDQDCFGVY